MLFLTEVKMVEEIKKDSNDEIDKQEQKPLPPLDEFKICEVWIRKGQIMLDASESFWADRCRALGLLEFCKDIVKTAQAPKKTENRIIPVKGSMMNFARNIFKRKK